MRQSRTKKQKPLVEIKTPLRAKVYRGKFRPFESTKFLDSKALRAVKQVTIEVGTIEFAGTSHTISAEIRKGMVVALKPVACNGCDPKKSRRVGNAALKKTIQLVGQKLRDGGISPPAMPIPLKVSARLGFEIPFGPIIIIIGDPGDGGFDLCFQIWIGNKLCWWCLLSPNGCIEFGPPF